MAKRSMTTKVVRVTEGEECPLPMWSGTPSNRSRLVLAVVLVHELCHLSRSHWSIDTDGGRRFAILSQSSHARNERRSERWTIFG